MSFEINPSALGRGGQEEIPNLCYLKHPNAHSRLLKSAWMPRLFGGCESLNFSTIHEGGHVGMEHLGGSSGMHGPGHGIGDSHSMRPGMWGGPGGGPGMHPPHGQGEIKDICSVGMPKGLLVKACSLWTYMNQTKLTSMYVFDLRMLISSRHLFKICEDVQSIKRISHLHDGHFIAVVPLISVAHSSPAKGPHRSPGSASGTGTIHYVVSHRSFFN